MLTHGSLFSGIGGFDLAAEWAGIPTIWQCEKDPYCRAVLEKHWPGVKRYEDIKELRTPPRCSIISGGFPCQPVSQAGQRRAQNDERWLWPEFARIIRAVRPDYVIVENVPGLLSRGFSDVLGDLAACGYDAEWDCIPAASVGAPHIRDRVWILAYSRSVNGGIEGVIKKASRLDNGITQRGIRTEAERRQDRELVALVPGIHSGVAEDWWRSQSRMDRSVNGLPNCMDRNMSLGNSIVPQVAFQIFEAIKEVENHLTT